jgi:hypothetical protein
LTDCSFVDEQGLLGGAYSSGRNRAITGIQALHGRELVGTRDQPDDLSSAINARIRQRHAWMPHVGSSDADIAVCHVEDRVAGN